MCIDFKDLNFLYYKIILLNVSVGDILFKILDFVVFIVMDLKEGFWYVKLDKDFSLYYILGWVIFGRYCWISLLFS